MHRPFCANERELQIIDGALTQLRQNEQAWETLIVARGLENSFGELKDRVRRSIQAGSTAGPFTGGQFRT